MGEVYFSSSELACFYPRNTKFVFFVYLVSCLEVNFKIYTNSYFWPHYDATKVFLLAKKASVVKRTSLWLHD